MVEIKPVVTGIKFKLKLNKEVNKQINDYFDAYGKAINYAVRIIDKELDPSKLSFAGKKNKETNEWIYPEEFCSCSNRIVWWNNKKPLCNDCYKLKYSENGLRKRMYSAKGRKAEHDINILNATNQISKTHFNYAIREAFILNKSIKKQKKERVRRLLNEKKKLEQFTEMKDGKTISLPKKERQRSQRYIHDSLKKEFENNPNISRGYTISNIQNKIKILDRNIKREESSLKEKGKIDFKSRRIMLDKSVKFSDGNKVNFTIRKNLPKEYEIDLPKKEKKLNWLREKLNLAKEQKPKYCYLLRKNNSFYLQYTLEINPKVIDSYKGTIGIDRGVSHIAVCTFLSNDGKITAPKFFSSGEILRLKNLQRERDIFLRGRHNKKRKKQNMRIIENRINLILHEYSKKIVEYAKKSNAFITFEKLEKIKKSRIRMPKTLRHKLSQFTFKRLSDLVDYKAKREGIIVQYVPPENTSKFCSSCGSLDTQRPFNGNFSLFKCNKCGIELNADYNASVNIAKKGLKILNS